MTLRSREWRKECWLALCTLLGLSSTLSSTLHLAGHSSNKLASLDAFGSVYDAIEKGGKDVLSRSSEVTQDFVKYR
ncbi:hypothetical protein R1flu_023422 [Riccia fluitans]|uniref:Senescence domain-containing protein n=1 Tax=Riccia fluitans TaxID=41844 RepID=A0ABD1XS07_9MARC